MSQYKNAVFPIPIITIGVSHNYIIFTMGIPITGKMDFIFKQIPNSDTDVNTNTAAGTEH